MSWARSDGTCLCLVDKSTERDPAILGFGRPLFDDYDRPIDLELLGQKTFTSGVTMHRYSIQDLKEAS